MADGFTRRIRGLGEGSSSTQNRPNIQNDNYSYYKVDKERESYKHKGGAWDPNRSFSNVYNEKKRNNEIGPSSIEKEYNNLNQEINDFRKEHESYKNDKNDKGYTAYGSYGDQNYQSYEQEALNRHNRRNKKNEFFNSLKNNEKKFKDKNRGYSKDFDFSNAKVNYPWMIKIIAVILFVIFIFTAYSALNSNDTGEEYDFQRQYEDLVRR